ncbi:polysaccharide biosynthesis protein [Pseudoxanthomonas taiwanensis]|uniref:Polysaccharide biosynthesis protein n=1 Tax=Pseudoxanthomonas taiwanensis TaxID=176598 RepID=A0A921TFF8_9GAMM|nr:polysaccharide biosynthesis protein [Pseudoxanthomonas taiwanensis]KAF1688287.1 polysaccharide biosynthesis protein [Pseudoxanthomonas taiwanensis]
MNKRILLICSSGGHMVQLKRLLPATADKGSLYLAAVGAHNLGAEAQFEGIFDIPDFNRQSVFRAFRGSFAVTRAVMKVRPTHVISTGAAPGIIGIAVARLMGARTLWVDSIANTRRLSMSGRFALLFSTHVFTQWPDLAAADGRPSYKGRLI